MCRLQQLHRRITGANSFFVTTCGGTSRSRGVVRADSVEMDMEEKVADEVTQVEQYAGEVPEYLKLY